MINLGFTEKNERSFSMTIIRTEKSKDSYNIIESLSLKNNILHYSKSHTGRLKSKPGVTHSKVLTLEEIEEVFLKFKQTNLYKDVTCPKHSEFQIPYSALSVEFLLTPSSKEHYAIHLYDLTTEIEKVSEYKEIDSSKLWLLTKFPNQK